MSPGLAEGWEVEFSMQFSQAIFNGYRKPPTAEELRQLQAQQLQLQQFHDQQHAENEADDSDEADEPEPDVLGLQFINQSGVIAAS